MIRMRQRPGERGSFLLENAMYLPILLVMLMGIIEIGRLTYTYYSLEKVLYTIARLVGTQQGINLCDDTDTNVQQAIAYALTGTSDGTGTPLINGLTADQIQVRIERFTAATGDIGQCSCDASGCDTANGGQSPDFIVVSLPNGFPLSLTILSLPLDPIILRPRVRMPYQGT